MTTRTRPTVAVWKFASCDGCQLTLLNCEDQLAAVAEQLDIRYFLEASSQTAPGPYDLSLVEGSITTSEDVARIHEIRSSSTHVVTIGACATAGGIQALRNFGDVDDLLTVVYATPAYISTLETSTPVSAHIPVDYELRGCPIDGDQLIEVISAFLADRKPNVAGHSVCLECKQRGIPCLLVARQTPCLGPVTHAGCGALCPAFDRGCYGCFGPAESPNVEAMVDALRGTGLDDDAIERLFHTFNAWSEPFRGPVPVAPPRRKP